MDLKDLSQAFRGWHHIEGLPVSLRLLVMAALYSGSGASVLYNTARVVQLLVPHQSLQAQRERRITFSLTEMRGKCLNTLLQGTVPCSFTPECK